MLGQFKQQSIGLSSIFPQNNIGKILWQYIITYTSIFFTFILGSLIIYAGNTFPYVMEIHFHKSRKYIHMYVKEMHSILWKKHPQFTVFFENYYLFLWLINN